MGNASLANKIKQHIANAKYGTVFVSTDFAELAEKTRISVILSRLETEGLLRRILRVYITSQNLMIFYRNILHRFRMTLLMLLLVILGGQLSLAVTRH